MADVFEGDDALLNKTAGSPAFMSPESLQSKTEYYCCVRILVLFQNFTIIIFTLFCSCIICKFAESISLGMWGI